MGNYIRQIQRHRVGNIRWDEVRIHLKNRTTTFPKRINFFELCPTNGRI
jgi:hypothetical protein